MTPRFRVRQVALACLAVLPLAAGAQDFSLHGYLDGRLVAPPGERSWVGGGLGKTRYGGGDAGLRFGGAALAGHAQLTSSLLAYAGVQLQQRDRVGVDLLEAYLRWRPVSTTRWRGAVQAGAFFPPVSLENDAIGWTSPWTLTPSAINSWVGEELRAVGVEARIERRGRLDSFELRGAVFQRNDPAGNLLAIRGWSLSDVTYGLGSRLREPDAYVRDDGEQPPMRYDPFVRLGHQWGNYAQLTWRPRGRGRVSLMHYDNHADPQAWQAYEGGERLYAWRTRFWSLGVTTDTGPISWLAQAMDGDTVIEPVPALVFTTRYRAAFLLAGWNRGRWRPALRVDHFSTSDLPQEAGLHQGEHGNAVTAALNWRPQDWLRLTFEVVHVDSRRTARVDYGLPAHSRGTQTQLSARLFY